MDKIWLNSYPPNVPAEIDPDQYRSLVHLLEESFSKFADRKAYVCMDKFLTYGELDAYSKKLASWLQSRGMQPGARVAIVTALAVYQQRGVRSVRSLAFFACV